MAAAVKRKWTLLLVAMALALVVFGALKHRPASSLSRVFDAIRIGMPGEKVEEILDRASGETDEISVLLEGRIESMTVKSKGGETLVIRCRRNGTKVLSGSVVDKEYYSKVMMAARELIERLRGWLRI